MKKTSFVLFILLCAASSVWAIAPKVKAPTPTRKIAEASDIPFPNAGVVEELHPEVYSRIVAISDVHGMYDTLIPLMLAARISDEHGNWKAGKTLLIVVGDSIDKGKDSIKVLNYWITLTNSAKQSQTGGAVVHLLGNHEAEFLTDPENSKTTEFNAELSRLGIPVLNIWNPNAVKPPDMRALYLRAMPLAARIGTWVFCHAGLFPNMPWGQFRLEAKRILQAGDYKNQFITGDKSILEAKDWWNDANTRQQMEQNLTRSNIFGVVFGHQHTAFNVSRSKIVAADGFRLIKIDTAMVPEYQEKGEVLVFTKPQQLNLMSPPEVGAIDPTGTLRPLLKQ